MRMNSLMSSVALASTLLAFGATHSSATILFQDSLQTDLSQWSNGPGHTGSGVIASAPGGGNALTFGQPTSGGDIATAASFTSSTGSFTLSFELLGNCGSTSGCGAFVGTSAGNVWLVSDTPFGATPQIPDTNGSWEQVSYTFSGTTIDPLLLEIWASSPHAGRDSVYFRDIVLSDNPDGTAVGTLNVSATPLPSTWLMLLSGFVGLGYFAYRGTKKNAVATA